MLLTILAFVFVLCIVIFVHELGHFLTAKRIGVKVHVFSLGFPPKLWGFKRGDTEYHIGVVPLGGYVKMAGGDMGEATGNPEELPSRSRLERLAILFMGPAMNILLAVALFTVLFMVGVDRPAGLGDPPVVRIVPQDSPAARAGIQPGDKILRVGDQEVKRWQDALEAFHLSPNQTLQVVLEREGRPVETEIRVEARGKEEVGFTGLFPEVQPQVMGLRPGFPAESSGLQKGDVIVKVNEAPIASSEQLIEAINKSGGQPVTLTVLRASQLVPVTITPVREGDRFLVGIDLPSPVVTERILNPVLAFGAAVGECARITRLTFITLARMIRGQLSMRQMMGPIGIARASGQEARRGARNLFYLMGVLSVSLGIFNLLPIPVLDGGHMAIILLEGLARRDFSVKLKERILQVGFVLLLLLMVTVIYLDLSKIDSVRRYLP
ncbi:MAG: RIP metalloprotease RseP [Acidobacteria bacterium]|nr:RIP metalloprotease RseP [Acidobacteriota bacterium]